MDTHLHLEITDYIFSVTSLYFLKINFKWMLDGGKNEHAQLSIWYYFPKTIKKSIILDINQYGTTILWISSSDETLWVSFSQVCFPSKISLSPSEPVGVWMLFYYCLILVSL